MKAWYGWISQAESVRDDGVADPERRERSDGIAELVPVVVEIELEGRRRKSADGASVLEQAIGEVQPGGRVVERDVAGERGAAGENHGRPVDEVRADGGPCRPPVRAEVPPGKGEAEPCDRERDDERGRELRRRIVGRRDECDDDDQAEARREQQDSLERAPADSLQEEAAAERQQPEDEREDEPRDKQTHLRAGREREGRAGADATALCGRRHSARGSGAALSPCPARERLPRR